MADTTATNISNRPIKLTRAEQSKRNKQLQATVQREETNLIKKQEIEVLKRSVGRPDSYKPELANIICEGIATGMSLRTVLGYNPQKTEPIHPNLPSIATHFAWLRKYPEYLEQYTQAREDGAAAMEEDMLNIADDGSNDWMDRYYGDQQEWVTNGEALQRSKLRVETRRWIMAKRQPKKYGDKLDLTSGGKDLPTPILGVLNAQITPNDTIDDVKPRKFIDAGAENHGVIPKPLTTDDIKDT